MKPFHPVWIFAATLFCGCTSNSNATDKGIDEFVAEMNWETWADNLLQGQFKKKPPPIPASGWTAQDHNSWKRDGAEIADRNSDGLIDYLRIVDSPFSYNHRIWVDSDYDGYFNDDGNLENKGALAVPEFALAMLIEDVDFEESVIEETLASPQFSITSDFADEANWVEAHLQASASALIRLMANPDVLPPANIAVVLEMDPDAGGSIGGWASPVEIGLSSDECPKETLRVWILTHELCNLFAAHYAGHGGFPSDWWSNGRSPFPAYLAGLVLRETGEIEAADWLRESSSSERDHEMYWALHEKFGFDLFAKTFVLLRRDNIDLGEINPPWPHPNQTRSAYTIAYLSLAAGTNLRQMILSYGIGHEPDDWNQIHPEIPFQEYQVGADEVVGIQRARVKAIQSDGSDRLRTLFKAGNWRDVIND